MYYKVNYNNSITPSLPNRPFHSSLAKIAIDIKI